MSERSVDRREALRRMGWAAMAMATRAARNI